MTEDNTPEDETLGEAMIRILSLCAFCGKTITTYNPEGEFCSRCR